MFFTNYKFNSTLYMWNCKLTVITSLNLIIFSNFITTKLIFSCFVSANNG